VRAATDAAFVRIQNTSTELRNVARGTANPDIEATAAMLFNPGDFLNIAYNLSYLHAASSYYNGVAPLPRNAQDFDFNDAVSPDFFPAERRMGAKTVRFLLDYLLHESTIRYQRRSIRRF